MNHKERKNQKPSSRIQKPPTAEIAIQNQPLPENESLIILSSDDGFAATIREIAKSYGFETHSIPLAGFGPGEVRRTNTAAAVDCRAYMGVSQKVVQRLRELHPDLPILAILGKGERVQEQRDRLYGSGANLCISEEGGIEALREGVHLLMRLRHINRRMVGIEDMLRSRNFEISGLRREMNTSESKVAKRVQEQITIYRAARAMLSVFDFDDLANEIVRLATNELGAEVGSLMIIEGDNLVVRALYGHIPGEAPILGRRQKVGEGISGWVAREGKPLLIKDIEKHEQFRERGGARYKTKSCIICPIITRGRIRGVLNINNKIDGGNFVDDDLRLLRTLAMTAALALDNFELIDQIKRSETMSSIGELATRMAHEIRNPLHAIKMNIQILAKKFSLGEDDLEYYDILLGEINRLENLVKEVLTFAKHDKLNVVSCDLGRVLERTLAVLKSLLDEKSVELNLYISPDVPLIQADESKLEQAIMNLVVNAVEAISGGGSLHIATGVMTPFIYPKSLYGEMNNEPRKDQKYGVITIQDTGSGIDRSNFDKIFKPFFTTKAEGTGLGLSTSRKIIEAHGGRLVFESELGVGTVFQIELPILDDGADVEDEALIMGQRA